MSHGPIDVFAAKNGAVLLIQVKSGSARIKKLELETLRKWAEEFDAQAEVWSFRKRGKPEIELVRASKRKQSRMILRPPDVARDLKNSAKKLVELAASTGAIPVSATSSSPAQC